MKKYKEYQLFTIIYMSFWILYGSVFERTQDRLDALIVKYLFICFLTNLILFFRYRKKYKDIIAYSKAAVKES
jgi:cbb3-type cytochrome oxidase subunit 3